MYERKKPLIELPGFVVESADDVQPTGVYVTKTSVIDGRTRSHKVFISKFDIHDELVRVIGKTFESEPLKTAQEWCDELGARIVDHDGWRGDPSRSWHDRITRAEFDRRLARCTVDMTGYPEFRVVPARPEVVGTVDHNGIREL